MASDPRKSALLILNRLDSGNKTLDALMDEFHESAGLSTKRDRAFMQALVYGVLRWRSRIDGIISRFSKTGLRKIEPKVLNILRLSVFQIVFMDRIPASAAVNTAVELAKSVSAPWTARFVNAVLRKAAAGSLPAAASKAEEKSMPEWLLSRWTDRFGMSQALAISDAVNGVPPITIRTNTLRTSRKSLLASFSDDAAEIFPTEFSPEGISFVSPKGAVVDMPGFIGGEFQVQDEAAQLAGHILSPLPGETVLDACAGLGGKTGHMAQLMRNEGVVYALDRDPQKLLSLEKEMQRLGIAIVTPGCVDLMTPPSDIPVASFDRILLDAPCSGLGVLRRNPDAKWTVSESDPKRLGEKQLRLLHHLAPLVKPSGSIVYVVCSTEPEETDAVIETFLKTHSGFRTDPIHGLKNIPEDCITDTGFFRTYPHRLSMDGFFAARMKRIV